MAENAKERRDIETDLYILKEELADELPDESADYFSLKKKR